MIHNIQSSVQALAILRDVASDHYEPAFHTTIFDLDESLDSNDVPTCLSQCRTCDLTVDFKTDQDPVIRCPRCGEEELKVIAVAEMVVQGSVVLWREVWYTKKLKQLSKKPLEPRYQL